MEKRKIKANWLPMEKDQFSQILIDIVDEILAEPEELMLKFAKNKDQMQDLLKGLHFYTKQLKFSFNLYYL